MMYHIIVLKILSIKVIVSGNLNVSGGSILYVSNHTSYIDIVALGSEIYARFTPKIEISKWPLMNLLVNLAYPVYIQRNSAKSLEQKRQILEVLHSGDNIVVFPEGTTNDGRKILPFKTTLFSVAETNEEDENTVTVQPVSIIYKKADGKIVNQNNIDNFAWYGDMDFISHFWNLLKTSDNEAKLVFHDEITPEPQDSRKAIAKKCEDVIYEGFSKESPLKLSNEK